MAFIRGSFSYEPARSGKRYVAQLLQQAKVF